MAAAAPAASNGEECKVRIFHINDVYILDNLPALKTCVATESKGFPEDNIITTLAGDFLGPSLLSSIDHGRGMVDCLNQLPLKAVCFGNHESDVPYQSLCRRIEEFKGAWINSNMPGFQPHCPEAHEFKFKGGRSAAFIGLNIGGGENAAMYRDGALGGYAEKIIPVTEAVDDAVAKAKHMFPEADCIIPLTHQDMADDVKLAEKGVFPIVLGGHDHDQFNEVHNGCPVVKAGQDARNVVIADLTWPAGAPKGSKPRVEVTTKAVAPPRVKKGQPKPEWNPEYLPDKSLMDKAACWERPAKELEKATLANVFTDTPLTSVGVRKGPRTMAEVLATALRDAVDADACFMNSGSVRASKTYADGTITYADLSSECPFPSSNIVIKILGEKMSAALVQSRQAWLLAEPEEDSCAFQHDEGVKVNERHEIVEVRGEPFDPSRTYNLMVDAYMVTVNPVLKEWAAAHPKNIPPDDAGSPALPILVQFFCTKAWRALADVDGDGNLDTKEIDEFFNEADINGDRRLDESEVLGVLKKKLGHMASNVVAQQMLSIADHDGDGKVSLDELHGILVCMVQENAKV